MPEVRLLDDQLWEAVQARQKVVAAQPAAHARKPKRLLSGPLRCRICGSGMTLNGGKYTCSAHRELGVCQNGKIIAAERIERRVLDGIRAKLLAPEAIAKAVGALQAERIAERRELLASRAPLERELAEIARKLERAQEMCLNEVISICDLKDLKARHAGRREALEAKLASLDEPADVAVRPMAAQAYARLAERLYEAMDDSSGEKVGRSLGL